MIKGSRHKQSRVGQDESGRKRMYSSNAMYNKSVMTRKKRGCSCGRSNFQSRNRTY